MTGFPDTTILATTEQSRAFKFMQVLAIILRMV